MPSTGFNWLPSFVPGANEIDVCGVFFFFKCLNFSEAGPSLQKWI